MVGHRLAKIKNMMIQRKTDCMKVKQKEVSKVSKIICVRKKEKKINLETSNNLNNFFQKFSISNRRGQLFLNAVNVKEAKHIQSLVNGQKSSRKPKNQIIKVFFYIIIRKVFDT